MKPGIIQKQKFLYCLKVGTKIKMVFEGGATHTPPYQTRGPDPTEMPGGNGAGWCLCLGCW